jgi:polyhydroxyalkanoate synthesis regulator phasin
MAHTNDNALIADYSAQIEALKNTYRNTPSNQTSKLEALRERIENFKRQIAQIEAYATRK